MSSEPPTAMTEEQIQLVLNLRGIAVQPEDLHALPPLVRSVREQAVNLLRVAVHQHFNGQEEL